MYEILDFCIRILYSVSNDHLQVNMNKTAIQSVLKLKNGQNITIVKEAFLPKFYFAGIVVGCLDVFISFSLLYVSARRKYKCHIVVFVAAVWCSVMGFLSLISFGFSISAQAYVDIAVFLISVAVEFFFAYVIFSYHKLMRIVLERGLDDTNMTYFPEQHGSFTNEQTDKARDEQPIMDDQDDLQMDDSGIAISS